MKFLKLLLVSVALAVASTAWAGSASVSDGYKSAYSTIEVDTMSGIYVWWGVTVYQNGNMLIAYDAGGVTSLGNGVSYSGYPDQMYIYSPDEGEVTVELSITTGGTFWTSNNSISYVSNYSGADWAYLQCL